jgi:surface antigen
MPMSPMTKFALPLALLVVAGSAHAQLLGPLWETNVTLTRADLDMIETTLAQKIHGKPAGTKAKWSDPSSGNSGTITLVKISELDGQRCEEILYRNRSSEQWMPPDRFELTSCRQPDGAWRLSQSAGQ